MKACSYFLIFIFISSAAYSYNKLNYLDPRPGANYVSTSNCIALGFDKKILLAESEILSCISVTGTKSSNHYGNVVICSGNKKIIFKPSSPFQEGEKVTVKLSGKLTQILNSDKQEYTYSFSTTIGKPRTAVFNNTNGEFDFIKAFNGNNQRLEPPILTVNINNNPSDGYIFMAPYANSTYLVITDKNGNTNWFEQLIEWCGDFKKQPNGNLTYWNGDISKHIVMDESKNIIDTLACGNGYFADIHELRVMNNGHAFLIAYDSQYVDMSQIVQGGNPNAIVVGLVIQEIDEDDNVVFQWRSWDHIPITNALHENLTASYIDYVHGNAIEIDSDGNILISSRHLDEITKINSTTGNIIWRLGGVNNQFTFINDTLRFNYQHAVRRISNGNLTIFDNGNWHNPQFSRAVEYSIDEINKTATLVWQYRRTPSAFGAFMGNVQRLENGNTLISWGSIRPTVTEVTTSGTRVFEASYPTGVLTYRAYKFSTPVKMQNGNKNIPASFDLHQNYPNPFNPVTAITYDITKTSYVELTVFDITGKELKKIVSGYQKPGNYTVRFDAAQYSSGLYIYRLNAGESTASKKMILIK